MTQRCAVRVALACIMATLFAGLLSGCAENTGPSRAATKQDMHADRSTMTNEQKTMMQEGMRRDAERAKAAKQNTTSPTQ